MKLCDVFPDGTSALVARGTLDLAFRDGVHGRPSPLVPGQEYDVVVDLDACAYEWTPGNRLRVSVAGADWPNTVAPPAPVTITTHAGGSSCRCSRAAHPAPTFTAGAEHSTETADGVAWEIRDDVLRRTTNARTHTLSDYDTPYDGHAREDYRGEVERRPAYVRADGARRDHPRPDLAGHRRPGAVGHGPHRHRRRAGRRHRDPGRRDGVEVSHRTWRETQPS